MFKFYLPYYKKNNYNDYEEFNINCYKSDKSPKTFGIAMCHQELISNFLKGSTPVEGLLLVHDMGTGKTCTAIQSIEKNIQDNIYGMKKAIILNRGKAIMNNFINELVNKCTTNYQKNKNLWSKFYSFDTFEIFSKKISKYSDEYITKNFNNTFLVIDEVHNILNEQSNVYYEIYRFIHLLKNKKILLLSGTPVKDVPENFIPIINLLLDSTQRINIKTFKTDYYDSNGNLTNEFKKLIKNKVSYLKASESEIPIKESGALILDLKHIKVVSHKMSEFQNKIYLKAFNLDDTGMGIYNNSRQASRFVFPDGSYGHKGFEKYVNLKRMTFNYEMKNFLHKDGTDLESVLKAIGTLSVLYEYKIRCILKADKNKEKTIIYDDLVKGSGIIVFALLLKFCNFTKFRLLTAETTTTNNIINAQKKFNEDILGEEISVILGSKVIAEGFTFKDVLHEHVVPHWNNTETSQVLARGIRMGSHENIQKLKPNAFVTTYRHVVFPIKYVNTSIDYIMTKTSENKELAINKILDAIKESSITCRQFSDRNGTLLPTSSNEKKNYDNVISTGNINKNLINKINNFYLNTTSAPINFLIETFNTNKEELLKTFEFLISNKISFVNNKGIKCYYNNYYDIFFITESIRTEHDFLMSYYTKDLKPIIQHDTLYSDAIEYVTTNSDKKIQRLLELSLTVKMLNLPVKNIQIIDDLLEEFKNYWSLTKDEAAVWYLYEVSEASINPMCLISPETESPWLEWKPCHKNFKDELFTKKFKELHDFENDLKNKNINYYGTHNPELNEFCVKNIVDITKEDKRKISGGKRCLNWKKDQLFNIAKNELKMNRNWKEWSELNRIEMCEDIKQHFEENNLLKENKYCGIQNKKH